MRDYSLEKVILILFFIGLSFRGLARVVLSIVCKIKIRCRFGYLDKF